MKKIQAKQDGWCNWQMPEMKRYRMGCCDCGLVHDFEFKVIKTKDHKNGNFEQLEECGSEFRVIMKAKRNNRSTAQVRRQTL
jgi:hypothetical protein